MKIIASNFSLNSNGSVTLVPEESEDLWHLYNIIIEGDEIRAMTHRKIVKENGNEEVSNLKVTKKKISMQIKIKAVDYDPAAPSLRFRGQNSVENNFLRLGQFHTIEISVNNKLTIYKQCWDSVFIKRLKESTDITKKADVAAVIMNDGIAHICLITANMTVTRQKIEVNIPKKKQINKGHEKAKNKFYDLILNGILKNVNFEIVKCVILASPGFVKDELHTYILNQIKLKTNELKILNQNKHKFLLIHTFSGHKQALVDVLKDPKVSKQLLDTKTTIESQKIEKFYEMLEKCPDKAVYGKKDVLKADELNAIDTLMITDQLFRVCDIKQRKRYVQLIENVKKNGGCSYVFSRIHVSGEQLSQLSGIAAILRFPVELDVEESEDEDEDEDSSLSDDEDEEDGEETFFIEDLGLPKINNEDDDKDDNKDGDDEDTSKLDAIFGFK